MNGEKCLTMYGYRFINLYKPLAIWFSRQNERFEMLLVYTEIEWIVWKLQYG
mgnify:CR=1 FL=1